MDQVDPHVPLVARSQDGPFLLSDVLGPCPLPDEVNLWLEDRATGLIHFKPVRLQNLSQFSQDPVVVSSIPSQIK